MEDGFIPGVFAGIIVTFVVLVILENPIQIPRTVFERCPQGELFYEGDYEWRCQMEDQALTFRQTPGE